MLGNGKYAGNRALSAPRARPPPAFTLTSIYLRLYLLQQTNSNYKEAEINSRAKPNYFLGYLWRVKLDF